MFTLEHFKTFVFEIILDSQQSCKDNREALFTLHFQSPNANNLYNHGRFIKIKELTSLEYL